MKANFKFTDLAERMSPVIARKDVGRLLGGVLSPKTLANLDAMGKGVKNRFRVGRTVCYNTRDLLQFLDERTRACTDNTMMMGEDDG